MKPRRSTKSRGVFVTGTDTAVGKTLVTAALALSLKKSGLTIGVMKPIETGVSRTKVARSDAVRLQAIIESDDALAAISPYRFELPVAPLAAAQAERSTIKLDVIAKLYRLLSRHSAYLLVEGVGGVHVPITLKHDVADLITKMHLPVVVVGRAGLGGINHALLTIEVLRRRKIQIVALVLNRTQAVRSEVARIQEKTTIQALRKQAGVPVLGPLAYEAGVSRRFRPTVSKLAGTAAIKDLAKLVRRAAR